MKNKTQSSFFLLHLKKNNITSGDFVRLISHFRSSRMYVCMYVCMMLNANCQASNWFYSMYAWVFGINKSKKLIEDNKIEKAAEANKIDELVNCFDEMDKDCNEFVTDSTCPSMSLNSYLRKINPNPDYCSSKDAVLYGFGCTMVHLEKKWKNWHVCYQEKNVQGTIITKAHCHEIKIDSDDPDKKITIRLDLNSPYFRFYNGNTGTHKEGFSLLNSYENQSYHNELQFMRTRLALMKMYKTTDNFHPNNQHSFWYRIWFRNNQNQNEENRKRAYKTLKEEYQWFKSDTGRKSFMRSCMKKSDFEVLSDLRDKYNAAKE